MEVPYAKKWQKETNKLRKIALDCYLTEELKWGKPCFTFQGKNVAIVIPLKESCALSFFKGALLKDTKHILQRIGDTLRRRDGSSSLAPGDHGSAADSNKLSLRSRRLGGVQEEGRAQEPAEYAIPEELQTKLNEAPGLKAAFEALTPAGGELLHLPYLKREAGKDPCGAGREVRADDPGWTRVQRAAELSLNSGDEFRRLDCIDECIACCRQLTAHLRQIAPY